MTALSAGSRTSPDADLERLTRWCLGRFHGKVSPGECEELRSLALSSDADRSSIRRRPPDMTCDGKRRVLEDIETAAHSLWSQHTLPNSLL